MDNYNSILLFSARRYHILILLVCLVALAFSYGGIDYTLDKHQSTDLAHYRTMAGYSPNLPQNVQQPFIYRILGPYLAGLLPLPDNLAFWLLEFISTILLVVLFYDYLCQSKIKPAVSLIVTIIFICNKYFVGTMLFNYFQVNDTLALLFILIMFRAMKKQQWIAFGLALLLGAMTRETTLLMIPVAFIYLVERNKITGNTAKFIISIIPAILILIVFRLILQPSHGDSPLEAFVTFSGKILSLQTWYYLFIRSFIPMTFIPLIFFRDTIYYLRQNFHQLLFIILVVISTLFGVNNERLMAPSFIVFYPMIAIIIQEKVYNWGRNNKLILALLITAAFLSSVHVETCIYPSSNYLIINVLSIGSLILVSVAMLYQRLQKTTGQAKSINQ